MVYPALTYLEEIGHASVEVEGTKKRYTISEAGLDHLEKNRAAVDALLEQLAWIGKRMGDLREAMSGGATEASDIASRRSPMRWPMLGQLAEQGVDGGAVLLEGVQPR